MSSGGILAGALLYFIIHMIWYSPTFLGRYFEESLSKEVAVKRGFPYIALSLLLSIVFSVTISSLANLSAVGPFTISIYLWSGIILPFTIFLIYTKAINHPLWWVVILGEGFSLLGLSSALAIW